MSNKELFKAICNEACSCDPMVGWSCNFCRDLKSKLEKALELRKKKVLESRKRLKKMKCKKHPKYQAKRYPTSECDYCLHIWNQKKGADRIMDKVDREYMEKLKRLDPPCDARAYAERYDFGNYDSERI